MPQRKMQVFFRKFFKKICFVNMLLIILKIIIEEAATIDPIETIFVGKYDAKKAIIPIMQIIGE